jgi:hypothetical protein
MPVAGSCHRAGRSDPAGAPGSIELRCGRRDAAELARDARIRERPHQFRIAKAGRNTGREDLFAWARDTLDPPLSRPPPCYVAMTLIAGTGIDARPCGAPANRIVS